MIFVGFAYFAFVGLLVGFGLGFLVGNAMRSKA